ncbi:hypothetical protein ABBQ38_012514 [Trebouxia sp. C0009 RCD-2024]
MYLWKENLVASKTFVDVSVYMASCLSLPSLHCPRSRLQVRVSMSCVSGRKTPYLVGPAATGFHSSSSTLQPSKPYRSLNAQAAIPILAKALSTAIVTQVTKGNWSRLSSLSLPSCRLNPQALSILSQGDWPLLRVLELSDNCLDAEGVALLAKGEWPSLRQIDFSCNPDIDAVAIAQLSAADWPLEVLKLCSMPICAATAAELAKLQLPRMRTVALHNTGLTAAGMSKLVRANWARLSWLDLSVNDLDAVAMQHLCWMHLPALKGLGVRRTNLAQEEAYWLALGRWPSLTTLNLSDNHLDAKAAEHIASGVWPRLQVLSLDGNSFGHAGLQQLTKGNWPLLHDLRIGLEMLEIRHSSVCLGLDPDMVQAFRLGTGHNGEILNLDREVSRAVGLWPELNNILIVG